MYRPSNGRRAPSLEHNKYGFPVVDTLSKGVYFSFPPTQTGPKQDKLDDQASVYHELS